MKRAQNYLLALFSAVVRWETDAVDGGWLVGAGK